MSTFQRHGFTDAAIIGRVTAPAETPRLILG
jgi:hypothetical protein